MAILVHSLPSPLFTRIIELPPVVLALRGRRLVGECIEFIDPAHLTGPRLDAFVYIPRFGFTGEIKAHERKIPTSQAD